MLPLELDRNEVSRSHSELNHNEVSRCHLTRDTNDQTGVQTVKINYNHLRIPFISIVLKLLYITVYDNRWSISTKLLSCFSLCIYNQPGLFRETLPKDIIANRSYAKVEMYFTLAG